MDILTLGGVVIGFGVIVAGILQTGELISFWDPGSVMIVFGGVIASTIVSYPLKMLKRIPKLMGIAFHKYNFDLNQDIDKIIEIANIARKDGLLALEDAVAGMDDPFMKKGIMLIVDGSDPELIKSILETELSFLEERHGQGHALFEAMSAYSPAFGMIGTLVGLINMLKNLSDMDSLGPNMSVALVTTFYGCMLANLLFTPISKKLKAFSSQEYLRKELMMEGMLSIQDGENPRMIKEKLTAFIARTDQAEAANPKQRGETAEDDGNGA